MNISKPGRRQVTMPRTLPAPKAVPREILTATAVTPPEAPRQEIGKGVRLVFFSSLRVEIKDTRGQWAAQPHEALDEKVNAFMEQYGLHLVAVSLAQPIVTAESNKRTTLFSAGVICQKEEDWQESQVDLMKRAMLVAFPTGLTETPPPASETDLAAAAVGR